MIDTWSGAGHLVAFVVQALAGGALVGIGWWLDPDIDQSFGFGWPVAKRRVRSVLCAILISIGVGTIGLATLHLYPLVATPDSAVTSAGPARSQAQRVCPSSCECARANNPDGAAAIRPVQARDGGGQDQDGASAFVLVAFSLGAVLVAMIGAAPWSARER